MKANVRIGVEIKEFNSYEEILNWVSEEAPKHIGKVGEVNMNCNFASGELGHIWAHSGEMRFSIEKAIAQAKFQGFYKVEVLRWKNGKGWQRVASL